MPRRREMEGYTLVELMLTVAMVAVLAVVTLPPVIQAVQKREVVNAAQAVLDLVEFSKVQAAMRNRAHELEITFPNGGNAVFKVNEGGSSACVNLNATEGVRSLTLDQYFPSIQVVGMTPSDVRDPTTNRWAFCIKPDGRVLRPDTGMPFTAGAASGYAAGEVRISLSRFSDPNTRDGIIHDILVPFNGAARVTTQGAL